MATFTNYKPNWAIHPGEDVKEFAEYRGWSNRELAKRMGVHENTITNLINGKDRITQDLAQKLAKIFDMKASFWMNAQAIYDESLPRQQKEEEKEVFEKLKNTYSEMSKRGWVSTTKRIDVNEKIENLCRYFAISSLLSLSNVGAGNIAFRKKEKNGFVPEILACWLRKGEIDMQKDKSKLKPFNKNSLKESLPKIKQLNQKNFSEIREKLVDILAESGIYLAYTPNLKNCSTAGATRYLGDTVLVQVSDMGKREDIFWFTLFHELGHVLLHLKKKDSFVDIENNIEDEKEKEADNYALNFLIDPEQYKNFINTNDFSEKAIKSFALSQSVDPGILVGRLQKEFNVWKTPFNKFRRRLEF